MCVAADINLGLKAEARRVGVVDLPATLLRTDEPDPSELEKRQLRKENADLMRRANSIPKVEISFRSGTDPLTISLQIRNLLADDVIDRELRRQRAFLGKEDDLNRPLVVQNILMMQPGYVSTARKEEYLREGDAWLRVYSGNAIARSLTFTLEFDLRNNGQVVIERQRTLPQEKVPRAQRDLSHLYESLTGPIEVRDFGPSPPRSGWWTRTTRGQSRSR